MKALMLAGFLVAGLIQAQTNTSIPPNARIYVDAGDGFDIFLTAALEKKHVPITVTTDKTKADFVLEGFSEHDKMRTGTLVSTTRSSTFLTGARTDDTASVRLVDVKSGNVIFAYAVDRRATIHGRQTAAESCAKHLGASIGAAPLSAPSNLPGVTPPPVAIAPANTAPVTLPQATPAPANLGPSSANQPGTLKTVAKRLKIWPSKDPVLDFR